MKAVGFDFGGARVVLAVGEGPWNPELRQDAPDAGGRPA
jgi:hypothetical protein